MHMPTRLCVEVVRNNHTSVERFFVSAEVERFFDTFNVVELYTCTILQMTPRETDVLFGTHLNVLARAYEAGQCAYWSVNNHGVCWDAKSWKLGEEEEEG